MKEQEHKIINKLTNKMMKETGLQTPSFDFTAQIMSKVVLLSQSKETVYTPLISKGGWAVILLIVLSSSCLLMFNGDPNVNYSNWFDSVDFNVLSNNIFTRTLSNITISKTVLYSIVLFGVVFFIQIPLLKNYFDRRLVV